MKKIDSWKNLLWEFRKRDTSEAQQVFADYFNPTTEGEPFAEMIEAVAEKIRERIAAWMNETAFDTLRSDFIVKLDEELINRHCKENEMMSLVEQDIAAINGTERKCNDLIDRMKGF